MPTHGGLSSLLVPLSAPALGAMRNHETQAAMQLANFRHTASGAAASSIAATAREELTSATLVDLTCLDDRVSELASGISADTVRATFDRPRRP